MPWHIEKQGQQFCVVKDPSKTLHCYDKKDDALAYMKALYASENRAIKDVGSWDGSASRWPDTASYCDACLINLNSAAGKSARADWSQENCKMPVRGPGDPKGTFVRQAMHAAAGALAGARTPLVKPSGVSASQWSAAVKKAASTLLGAYHQAKEDAPDSLYKAAGKTPPKRNMFRELLKKLNEVFSNAKDLVEATQRAYSLEDIESAVEDVACQQDPWCCLLDLFIEDDDSLTAVLTSQGKIYKTPVTVDTTDGVTLGDWQEVMHDFVPVKAPGINNAEGLQEAGQEMADAQAAQDMGSMGGGMGGGMGGMMDMGYRNRMTIIRQADGRYRGFLISSTSVINRVGEIDSTELHDNMNRKAQATGHYPYIDFYHLGEKFRLGQSDFLARDGYVAIASFLFDQDTPLAEAMIDSYAAHPDYWGASISFRAAGEPDHVYFGDIPIPVYRDGEYVSIAILPERSAASLFTALRVHKEVQRMNKSIEEALKVLAGDNEELLQKFITMVDSTNRSIESENLIARSEDKTEEAEQPASEAAVAESVGEGEVAGSVETRESTGNTEVIFDETNLPLLASALVQTPELRSLKETVDQLAAAVTAFTTFEQTIQEKLDQITQRTDERLHVLEQTDEEKQRTWSADMGRRQVRKVTVSYRPRAAEKEEVNRDSANYADVAEATLANLK